jgi:hypothetical protein
VHALLVAVECARPVCRGLANRYLTPPPTHADPAESVVSTHPLADLGVFQLQMELLVKEVHVQAANACLNAQLPDVLFAWPALEGNASRTPLLEPPTHVPNVKLAELPAVFRPLTRVPLRLAQSATAEMANANPTALLRVAVAARPANKETVWW